MNSCQYPVPGKGRNLFLGVVGEGGGVVVVMLFVISLWMADSFIHCGVTQDFPELQ